MKLKKKLCVMAIFVIPVALAVVYAAIPAKTIFEITDWSTNSHDYVRITIREIGMDDNGIGVHIDYETEDKNLIKEILGYLSTYELKIWYKKKGYFLESDEKVYDILLEEENFSYKNIRLVDNYVSIFNKNDNKNYRIVNKDRIDQRFFQGLVEKMKCEKSN